MSRAADRRDLPQATVARLPIYHRALDSFGVRSMVSSAELAVVSGVSSAMLRKDLSHLGSYGTRGVGYDVDQLRDQIGRVLGLSQDWPVVIVGIGNLGHALAGYAGFATRGFRVVGLFDASPSRVGEVLDVGDTRLTIRSVGDLESVLVAECVAIGVIATPAAAAQSVCNRLVSAGVGSILNFAPIVLDVPDHIEVRKVDLAVEMQILAFHERSRRLESRAVTA